MSDDLPPSGDDAAHSTEPAEVKYHAGTALITEWPALIEAEWSRLKSSADLQDALRAEGADVDALLNSPRCPIDVRQEGQGLSTAAVLIIFQIVLWTPQGKAFRKGVEETFQRHLSDAAPPEFFEKAGSALIDSCLKWLHSAIAAIRWRRGVDVIGDPVERLEKPKPEPSKKQESSQDGQS